METVDSTFLGLAAEGAESEAQGAGLEDAEGEGASTTFNVTVEKSPSKVFEVPWKAVLIIVVVALAFVAGWALRRRRSQGRVEPPDEEEDVD